MLFRSAIVVFTNFWRAQVREFDSFDEALVFTYKKLKEILGVNWDDDWSVHIFEARGYMYHNEDKHLEIIFK